MSGSAFKRLFVRVRDWSACEAPIFSEWLMRVGTLWEGGRAWLGYGGPSEKGGAWNKQIPLGITKKKGNDKKEGMVINNKRRNDEHKAGMTKGALVLGFAEGDLAGDRARDLQGCAGGT